MRLTFKMLGLVAALTSATLLSPTPSLASTATITATVDTVGAMASEGGRIRINGTLKCPGGDDKALWLMQGSGAYGSMTATERQAAHRMIALATAALLSGRTVTISYETTPVWGYCYGYSIRIN